MQYAKEKDNKIGPLFHGQDGEQLINVAISRAKSKLIIIGDITAILRSESHLTTSMFKQVLRSLQQ